MSDTDLYTIDEVCRMVGNFLISLTQFVVPQSNLDNRTSTLADSLSEGDTDMAKRIKQKVVVNGQEHWITGENQQGLMESYMRLCIKEGLVVPPPVGLVQNGRKAVPTFGKYLTSFIKIFKSGQQTSTMINRERIIQNHVLPKLGNIPIDEITTADIQMWFDELAEKYSKETIMKIKNVIGPAFDAAVEDGLISRNPIKSNRITIGGRETVHHKAIPQELMTELRIGLDRLGDRERRMAALLSTTGMRFEEVLGLRWEDIDAHGGWVTIERAVVHPTRNQPEVKTTKTESSKRKIPLPKSLLEHLAPLEESGFILHSKDSETPLSYTEARRSFNKIREEFNLKEYSAHDFRDTCATEWREQGIPTDIIARMLGHTKSEITEKRYVKYRSELYDGIRMAMDKIGDTNLDPEPPNNVVQFAVR